MGPHTPIGCYVTYKKVLIKVRPFALLYVFFINPYLKMMKRLAHVSETKQPKYW